MALLSPITKRSTSGFFDSPPRDDAFGVTGRGRKLVRQLQPPAPQPSAALTLSDSEASQLSQEVLEKVKALDEEEQGLLKGTLHDIARATTARQVLKAFARADVSHIPPRLHVLHTSVCEARGGGRKRNLSKLQAQSTEEQREEKPIYKSKPAKNRTDSRLGAAAVGAQPVPGRILPAGRLSPTYSNSPSPTSLPSCSSPLFTQPTDQRPHKNLSHSNREVGDLAALLSTLIKESPNQGQGRPSNLPSVTPTPETSFTGRGCIPKLDRSLSPTHSSPLAPISSPPQVPSTFTSSISTNPGEVSDAVYRSILDLLSASKGGKQ